jgi:pimeloyl-ACP methyl ester carboxylesterase
MTIVETPRKRGWVRWLKRIVLAGVLLVVLLVLAGTVYEWTATRADARRFPQQGRSVDVGGFRLNIDCTGTAPPGTPTVILESGAGVPALGWKFVQPDVAKFTRVCSYDRAGYGWSDPPPVTAPRTSLQVAKELHALLQNASVPPPYVLVGHSLGGYNIRVYNAQYPGEVAGAVFVDSSHEDQVQNMPPSMKKLMEAQTKSSGWEMTLVSLALHTGVVRLIQRGGRGQEPFPLDFLEEIEYLQRRKAFIETSAAEVNSFEESANQTRNSGNFGDKPLIVLTAGKIVDVPGLPKKDMEEFQQAWIHKLQPRLARLSTGGRQVIVPNSDHMIPMEQPQAVVEATREVVQMATRAPQ